MQQHGTCVLYWFKANMKNSYFQYDSIVMQQEKMNDGHYLFVDIFHSCNMNHSYSQFQLRTTWRVFASALFGFMIDDNNWIDDE